MGLLAAMSQAQVCQRAQPELQGVSLTASVKVPSFLSVQRMQVVPCPVLCQRLLMVPNSVYEVLVVGARSVPLIYHQTLLCKFEVIHGPGSVTESRSTAATLAGVQAFQAFTPEGQLFGVGEGAWPSDAGQPSGVCSAVLLVAGEAAVPEQPWAELGALWLNRIMMPPHPAGASPSV